MKKYSAQFRMMAILVLGLVIGLALGLLLHGIVYIYHLKMQGSMFTP